MKKLFPIIILILLISCKNSNKPTPLSFDELVDKGQVYLKNNQLDSAVLTFQKVIEIAPNKPDGYYGIGVAKAILCHKNNFHCSEAINYLEKTISIEPNHEKALYNLGVCYTSSGNYSKSIVYFDKAIAQDSSNGQYYCNRGYSKLSLSDDYGACEDFNTALHFGADKAKVYLEECK